MTRRTFGKTWWGERWIESMETIDIHTNRLPRGRRYARNGSVRSLGVEGGAVVARVQGSRPRPYDIRIALRQFSPEQVRKVVPLLLSRPEISAALEIGRLPAPLLDLFSREGLPLFPGNWEEIEARCSCPDWANPCKHLAAVYYLLANEIDKDPFLLLTLHGVDRASLGKETPGEGASRDSSFVRIPDLPSPGEFPVFLSGTVDAPDFGLPPVSLGALFSLLPKEILFHDGDFRLFLSEAYKNVMKGADPLSLREEGTDLSGIDFTVMNQDPESCEFFLSPPPLPVLHPFGDPPKKSLWTREVPVFSAGVTSVGKRKGRAFSDPSPVLDLFSELPLRTSLLRQTPSARALSFAASLALSFLRSGAFLPRVFFHGEGDFSVRYFPAFNETKSREALHFLSSLIPPGMIYRSKDRSAQTGEGAALSLLSLFLSRFVARFSDIPVPDKLFDAVFRGKTYVAEKFDERQTGKAFSDWLSRLSIRSHEISPVVRLDPEKEKFALRIAIEHKGNPLSELLPLSALFRESGKPIFSRDPGEIKKEVLRQITVAGEAVSSLRDVLRYKGRRRILLSASETAAFLTEGREILNLLGIRVLVPKALRDLSRPTLGLRARVKGSGKSGGFLSLSGLLEFSWELAVGGKSLTEQEIGELLMASGGVVRFRDQYLLLDPLEVRKLLSRMEAPPPSLSPLDLVRAHQLGESRGVPFHPDESLSRLLSEIGTPASFRLPEGLAATLRPYQERGVRWLSANVRNGFGVCLADDMGLGKTLQTIALLLHLKEQGTLSSSPALVICPTALVGNWSKECERFAPALSVSIYHGTERRMKTEGVDLLITTYGIVRREGESFGKRSWGALVLDEAQNIKNPETVQSRILREIPSGVRVALSGTPVENRLTEIWSIFDFINRGYLGSLDEFRKEYVTPIEKYRSPEAVARFRKITSPFLLRRMKTDKSILPDLPEKMIIPEYCSLVPEQAALYRHVLDGALEKIAGEEGIARKGLILALITSLKQVSNHPVHYLKKGTPFREHSGKADRAVGLVENILSGGEKVLVFTQYREMGDLLVDLFRRDLGTDPLFFHGGLSRGARDCLVEEFQNGLEHPVMILSIKAGGTGLNLTRASHVLHYDLWWNPAVEAQATDRAHRIGQRQNVTVHRLITVGTFEEKIDAMLQAKKELTDLTVAAGETMLTEMSDRELRDLFRLREI